MVMLQEIQPLFHLKTKVIATGLWNKSGLIFFGILALFKNTRSKIFLTSYVLSLYNYGILSYYLLKRVSDGEVR